MRIGGLVVFMRRYLKEISGVVFLDSKNDNTNQNSKQFLRDVGIKLFAVGDSKILGEKHGEIRVVKENQILSTKTNDRGEFRFIVNEGAYSVNLDVDTLPVGKGVIEASRFFDIGEGGRVDFAVKDVESMHMYDPIQINIGEHFIVNPVARDRDGNILSAKINYLSEDSEIDLRSNVCRSVPKSLRNTSANIILDGGKAKWRVPVDITLPRMCSIDKVDLANRLGLIDEHTKIRYSLYAMYNKRNLPEDYQSRIPIKSGTRVVEEISRYMERADADQKVVEAARQSLDSPVPKLDRTYRSPSGYFNIHYTLSGENAVALRNRNPRIVPPYIEQAGLVFDQVRAFTCASRGFREPILEDCKNAYDIYVYDLKGKYGITYSSQTYSIQNTQSRVASSYICIDNNYSSEKGFDKSREDCLRVTAAHEFFHAVQYAYNAEADSWWKEASATWNEDEIYTGINDYIRYINSYLSAPYKSLDEISYGGVIFAKFLSENYGGYNIVKRIWEMQASGYNNSIGAIDMAIRESYPEQDLGRIFDRFSAYNVNPAQYYKEGALWKTSVAVQNTYSDYPVAVNFGHLNHLSSNYQLFKASGSLEGKSLRIIVGGADGARWGFKLQKRMRGEKLYSTTEITSSGAFNRAEITLKNFGDAYDEIYLIPANLEKERNGVPYTYSASIK